VDLASLKSANIVPATVKVATVIDSGVMNKAVQVKGLRVTPGAKSKIEAAGGRIEV